MISKQAIEAFLKRELDSYEWMKSLSEDNLDEAINDLDPRPKFHTKPFKHQKVAFLIGIYNPEFLYFLDMGLGKSKIVLDLLSYNFKIGEVEKALVLVPNVVNIESWIAEAELHAPHLKTVPLLGNTVERHSALTQTGNVFVINYQGLVYLCTEPPPKTKGKGKKKKGRVISKEKVEEISSYFDAMILDESQKLKNWQSLTFKICSRIASECPVRYALTGTPFGRDPQDLWPQFYAIDRGETLGPTLTIFRECFFNKKKNYWGGYEFIFKKNMNDKLHRMLKHKSLRYSDKECQDLPQQIFSKVKLKFPVNAFEYYQQYIEQLKQSEGDYKQIENVFLRMRQICSGFVGHKDGDEKFEIDLPENPKLDALMELIDEMPKESKCVVFHDFIHTGNKICEALENKKIGHERLYSGTKDPSKALNNFKNKKKCKIFVVNSQSGSAGLNLQVANYCVFFESPVSPIVRAQAEKRVHRTGQSASRVYYYDLVISNSVDEKILAFLKEGKDLFKALVEGGVDAI